MTGHRVVPDVRKSVIVPVPPAEAFSVFAERPLEWFPPEHVFVADRQELVIEPRVGGRYYERGRDGEEAVWGTILEWSPPRRITMTWRVGAGWRPVFDDDVASRIVVDFRPAGSGTEVSLTHTELHRHGEVADRILAALDGPSPGPTLERYAQVVARHRSAASDDDYARLFRRQGFVHVPGVLTPAEVEHFLSATRDLLGTPHVERWQDWEDDNRTIMRYVADAWLRDDVLARLALHPRICALAEHITGRRLRLLNHEVLVKDPHDSVVTAIHDDDGGIPAPSPSVSLAAWVALVDVPAERGCLTFVPGSHLRPDAPPGGDPWDVLATWPEAAWEPRVTVPLRAGDCTFHHRRTIHLAGANETDLPRISSVTRYIDAEARYQPRTSQEGDVALPGLEPGDPFGGDRHPLVPTDRPRR